MFTFKYKILTHDEKKKKVLHEFHHFQKDMLSTIKVEYLFIHSIQIFQQLLVVPCRGNIFVSTWISTENILTCFLEAAVD